MHVVVRPGTSVVRRFRGAASTLLAFALFASPVLESLHEAQRVHFACPEDGELVDAPLAPAHRHAHASGSGAFLFAEHDSSGLLSSEGGHDHCAIAAQAHLRAREKSNSSKIPPVSQGGLTATAAGEQPELTTLAIYRFAPKASPPLA